MACAGVVDDDVDATELADRIIHGALDIRPSGDVACERHRAMADLYAPGFFAAGPKGSLSGLL